MKNKQLIYSLLCLIIMPLLSGTGLVLYYDQQVGSLSTQYTVWSEASKSYELVAKKPKSWVSITEVSKQARWAIVISEDWAFYDHKGLDLNQLKIVIDESFAQGKLARGASTITQQVIKNSLLSNERSLFRKAKEMLMAILIERKISKDQILERYLNLIELGKNIYGIKQASLQYFNKKPKNLNAKEGAFLAMLLPSPTKYAQSFRDKKLTNFGKEQVSRILVKLRQARIITEEQRVYFEKDDLSFEILNGIDGNILSVENESYE